MTGGSALKVCARAASRTRGSAIRFKADFDAGKAISSAKLAEFLESWLRSHILQVDKRLGAFLNKKGVT